MGVRSFNGLEPGDLESTDKKVKEFGISRCKLEYTGWIINKVPLSRTGNYIQHPVINHDGKQHDKEHTHA